MNPLDLLAKDRVTLVKKDGRRFPNLPAVVPDHRTIMTNDPSIPIEDGDDFERTLPSGVVELFAVLDAGFRAALPGLPAGYSSKVRKSTAPAPVPQRVVNNYNLVGPNSRVNNQSVDSSTNVVNVESHQVFTNIR
jgi:hypothetical protein